MVTLHIPLFEELAHRRDWLADPATMAYNHAYGGTIPFPPERWADWYGRWVSRPGAERFYRYLADDAGQVVGKVAYHRDAARGIFLADVLVTAPFRGKGYGGQGLELLCRAAKARGLSALWDDIAADNPALSLFLAHGFREISRDGATVTLQRGLVG